MKLAFKFKIVNAFLFCFTLFNLSTFSQVKDKDWLLVDGVDYTKLHATDRYLLDSILPLYHKAKHDSVKLSLLNSLIENCNDEALWPKYNDFMLSIAQNGDGSKFYLIYQAAALNNIGYDSDNKGDVNKAIDYYTRALKLREKAGDKKGIAESTNNLGSLYSYQNDTRAAIACYEKAVKLYEEIGDIQGSAQSLNNMGNGYNNIGNHQKAIEYNVKALQIQEKYNDKLGMSNSLDNLGTAYEEVGDTNKAIEYYSKSLEIREELGNKSSIAQSLYNLGDIYYERKNITKAKFYADKSFQLAKELGFPKQIEVAADLLYKIYQKENNSLKALEMYKLYIKMRDSTNGIELVRETTSSKYKWQEEQVKMENEKQTAIAAAESKRQKLFLLLVAIVAIAIGVIAIIVYKNLQRYKKAKQIIEKQKELVEEKQKEVLDSIRYAKRIQDAVLKEQEHVSAHLPGHFVFFQPKDIVSGDFYWAIEKNNHWYVAAADCTGHGVPGAFLTILGSSFLNEINATENLLTPANILDELRLRIISQLSVSHKEGSETKDGMDISLARLNLATKELMWAGANNPLWISSVIDQKTDKKEYKLTEIAAHNQPIGFYPSLTPYPNHVIQLNQGDSFYLFTDGYADQFGGPKGKKLKYKTMKDILLTMANESMENQKKALSEYFTKWKGDYEQTDDVCVIGINIY